MVIWGAIWGAVLGMSGHGYGNSEFQLFLGAILGALAGLEPAFGRAARAGAETRCAAGVSRAPRRRRSAAVPDAVPVATPARHRSPLHCAAARPDARRPRSPAVPAAARSRHRLFLRARDWLFGGNTVVRMGVLVLFVGLAFLAKYAVENACCRRSCAWPRSARRHRAVRVGCAARKRAPDKRAFA
jgi:hypothetical protein